MIDRVVWAKQLNPNKNEIINIRFFIKTKLYLQYNQFKIPSQINQQL